MSQRTNSGTPVPTGLQFDWGMLVILSLVLLALGAVAFVAGTQPATWFYPVILAGVVFLLGSLFSLDFVPRGATWEPLIAIAGLLFSLALVLGVVSVGFGWWMPVLVSFVILGVGALLRRI